MKAGIFYIAIFVFISGTVASGQLSVETQARLCLEKQQGLERLNAEAKGINEQITLKETELALDKHPSADEIRSQYLDAYTKYELIRAAMAEANKKHRPETTTMVEERRQSLARLAYWDEMRKEAAGGGISIPSNLYYGDDRKMTLRRELRELQASQTASEREISLMRENIASLDCESAAVNVNLTGPWESRERPDGPWAAASIADSGSDITFFNERGGTSKGHFVSKTRLIATQWAGGLAATVSDNGNTITWDNGSVWRRKQ